MKKIISYFVVALMVVCLTTSCDDFLKEELLASSDQEGFLNDADNAEASLYSVYATFSSTSLYGRWWPAVQSIMRSDDVGPKQDGSTAGLNSIMTGGLTNSSIWLGYGPWSYWWIALNRTNYVIDGLENRSSLSEEEKTPILGEARTLRAFVYLNLVRHWGDVPKMTWFSDQATAEITAGLDRAPAEDIYKDVIIPDLIYASENAPASYSSTQGRMTKYLARTLLAEAYVTMAGYRYDSVTGTMETFPASDTGKSYWELAREAAYSVVYDAACPYSLNTVHSGNGPAYAEAWDTECSKESLFELIYLSLSGYGSWLSRDYPCNKNASNFLGAAGSYPLAYEFPDETTNKMSAMAFTGGSTQGMALPTADLYRAFEDGDERKWGILTRYDVDYTPSIDGTIFCQPAFRKYMDFDVLMSVTGTNFQYCANNLVLYRYADAMLLFAEADNELNGPTAEGIAQINALRNRAGLADLETGKTADKDAFRAAIRQERRVELHGELKRTHDLIRWNIIKEETSTTGLYYYADDFINEFETQFWRDSLGNDTIVSYFVKNGAAYRDSVAYIHGCDITGFDYTIPDHYRALPIPYNQMQYNPEWPQTYGY